MKVVIEIEPDLEIVDADDLTGLTEAGYEALIDALGGFGDIIAVRQEED